MLGFNDITVKIKSEDGNSGVYEIAPLPRGYGFTLANALRRILLSSLEGAGVTSVKINGIQHEYSTIDGIREDVLEMILNLKTVRFKCSSDEPQVCTLEVSGKKVVKASDIKVTGEVEVMTPDIEIANLTDASASLSMEVVVEKGLGYKEADEALRSEIGRIPLDTDFTPVKKISYNVLQTRKGQEANLDLVAIEITTDGSIKPIDALLKAAEVLQQFAGKVMGALGVPVEEVTTKAEEARIIEAPAISDNSEVDEIGSWKVEDLPISKRSKSGLLAGGYQTVADLRTVTKTALLALPGFGNKSLNEVLELLNQYNIEVKD